MLLNVNPFTLFYVSDDEIGLAKLSPDILVPHIPLSGRKHNVLKEEKKRWLCADVLLAGESSTDEGIYDRNCVRALSLILWEILTDTVPFSNSTSYRAGQIVCEGGMPDIEVLNGIDERFSHIISAALMRNGRRRVGFDQLHSLLREYAEEAMGGGSGGGGGERETDQTLPPDTAVVVLQDNSEVNDDE